jgi:hypothetical protein
MICQLFVFVFFDFRTMSKTSENTPQVGDESSTSRSEEIKAKVSEAVESAKTSIADAVKTAEAQIEKASESVGGAVHSAKSNVESAVHDKTSGTDYGEKSKG